MFEKLWELHNFTTINHFNLTVRKYYYFLLFPTLIACKNSQNHSNTDAYIVLGDSSTIVTETDSQYLKNNFDDLTISTAVETPVNSETQVINTPVTKSISPDTVDNTTSTPNNSNTTTVKGYLAELSKLKLTFIDKTDKQIRKSSSNSFVISKQNYPTQVQSSQGDGVIKSRYVTVLYFNKDGQRVRLKDLGEYRGKWVVNKSQNGLFKLDNIISKASFKNVNANQLQKSIQNNISQLKINQKEKNKLVADIKKISSIKHSNIEVVIEKIEWDIEIKGQTDKLYITF